ncbi:Uncharacterised protein [Citrobacter koseri]|nr:Uncharacterised protein [Citrobacter koseri]
MMNVYKSLTVFTIYFLKIKTAAATGSSMMVNTSLSCFWITLVGVYRNLLFLHPQHSFQVR